MNGDEAEALAGLRRSEEWRPARFREAGERAAWPGWSSPATSTCRRSTWRWRQTVGSELATAWVDPADVGAPGAAGAIPEAAVSAAVERGYGLATSRRAACVYMRTDPMGGPTPGEEIDRFMAAAGRIVALLDSTD